MKRLADPPLAPRKSPDESSAATSGVRLIVVDDHPVVRSGIVRLMEDEQGIEVVGHAGNGAQAVELAGATRADVVLMDLRMPSMGGVEATREILALPDAPRVVILTTYDTDSDILKAVRAGAVGYLLKDAPREEIAAAVRAAARGRPSMSPSIASRLMRASQRAAAPPGPPLSPREREVLATVAQGLSNAEIGARLYVSEATVKTHLLRAYAKLGVDSRAAAVAEAMRRGDLDLERD